jgi:hypothetical protein
MVGYRACCPIIACVHPGSRPRTLSRLGSWSPLGGADVLLLRSRSLSRPEICSHHRGCRVATVSDRRREAFGLGTGRLPPDRLGDRVVLPGACSSSNGRPLIPAPSGGSKARIGGFLLPLRYPFGSEEDELGVGGAVLAGTPNRSGSPFCRALTQPDGDLDPMGATGLEPVTSSLSSWRSPN